MGVCCKECSDHDEAVTARIAKGCNDPHRKPGGALSHDEVRDGAGFKFPDLHRETLCDRHKRMTETLSVDIVLLKHCRRGRDVLHYWRWRLKHCRRGEICTPLLAMALETLPAW